MPRPTKKEIRKKLAETKAYARRIDRLLTNDPHDQLGEVAHEFLAVSDEAANLAIDYYYEN